MSKYEVDDRELTGASLFILQNRQALGATPRNQPGHRFHIISTSVDQDLSPFTRKLQPNQLLV